MLEAGQIDLYEEAYQRGYEIGVTRSQISSISMVIEDIKISLSEEKWMRYKKAEEEKHRKYVGSILNKRMMHKVCMTETDLWSGKNGLKCVMSLRKYVFWNRGAGMISLHLLENIRSFLRMNWQRGL